MAMSNVRSAVMRTALRGGSKASSPAIRSFSSSAEHDAEKEITKWKRITYVSIVGCTILAAYNLSKGHPHYEKPPPYPYLRIRTKEFPWGPDGLFEHKDDHH